MPPRKQPKKRRQRLGRPSSAAPRHEMMNFRVSDHELEIINRLIRHEGLTLSEIARGLILARAKRLGLM